MATTGGAVGMIPCLYRVKAIVDHPATHFFVGLVLIVTGVMEICQDFMEESRRFRLGAHHGIVILGLAQALAALPDLVHGIERWLRAAETAKGNEGEKE